MTERERILKLLEEGKITADEAVRLLEALAKSSSATEPLRRGVEYVNTLFRNVFRALPLMLKEVMRNPLQEPVDLTWEVAEGFTLRHVGGDLTLRFVPKPQAHLKARGYVHQNGQTIEVVSEETLLEFPEHHRFHLELAGGDLHAEGNTAGGLVEFVGGDLHWHLRQLTGDLEVRGETGDAVFRLPEALFRELQILARVHQGTLHLPQQPPQEDTEWHQQGKGPTLRVKIVFGDLTFQVDPSWAKS